MLGTQRAIDVNFEGPVGTVAKAQECVQRFTSLIEIVDQIEVKTRLGSDDEVITRLELPTSGAPPATTAYWSRIIEAKIARIRITFDPRQVLSTTGNRAGS